MKRNFLESEIRRRKLTYTAVGKATGVSRPMINRVVNCKCNPSWNLQQRLVSFFGIPSEKLLAVDGDTERL